MSDGWQVAGDAAEVYERELVPALFTEWPVHARRAAELSSGQRLLDVACGTGVVTRPALDLGCVVTGVDLNAGMLDVARSLAPLAEFFEASAESLPFPDDSFDAAIMQFGLVFPDRTEARFESVGAILRGEIDGSPLAGHLSSDDPELVERATSPLSEFVHPDGRLEFPNPAVIARARA